MEVNHSVNLKKQPHEESLPLKQKRLLRLHLLESLRWDSMKMMSMAMMMIDGGMPREIIDGINGPGQEIGSGEMMIGGGNPLEMNRTKTRLHGMRLRMPCPTSFRQKSWVGCCFDGLVCQLSQGWASCPQLAIHCGLMTLSERCACKKRRS